MYLLITDGDTHIGMPMKAHKKAHRPRGIVRFVKDQESIFMSLAMWCIEGAPQASAVVADSRKDNAECTLCVSF